MIKKADIILSIAIIVAGAVLFLTFNLLSVSGSLVVITVEGEVFGEYSLNDDLEIEVQTKLGYNNVQIKDGSVKVLSASCPDKYCVSHISIDKTGQTIVCLPHKMIIEIKE